MFIRNLFPIVREQVNLQEQGEFINSKIESLVTNLNALVQTLDLNLIKRAFWGLANDEIEYHPENMYHCLAVAILRLLSFEILFREQKITIEHNQILNLWFNYLFRRLTPHIQEIDDDFFIKLAIEVPVGNVEESKTNLEIGLSIIEDYDIYLILRDDNIDIATKVRKFKESYLNFYDQFLNRAKHFGDQMIQFETSRYEDYGKELHKIFDIYNKDSRAPHPAVCEAIDILKHLRNSFSHGTYTINRNSSELILRDRDWTSRPIPISDLWTYFHYLISIDKTLTNLGVIIFIFRKIVQLANQYNVYILCSECGHIDLYYIPPNTEIVICRNCNMPHLARNLRRIGLNQ